MDTVGRIEWMMDSSLAENYSCHQTSPDTLVVPTQVQHELYNWLCRETDQATIGYRRDPNRYRSNI
jgi:hypothetical protein